MIPFDGYMRVLVQYAEQHTHVLETGIHALPGKGYHGVGGIADDDGGACDMVRRAFDADERQVRVAPEGGSEIAGWDQRADTRKVPVEERHKLGTIVLEVGLKSLVHGRGREQGASKGAILGNKW